MAKNLKLKAARAALDMTRRIWRRWWACPARPSTPLKREYNPTINLCRSICKVLGKTLDELFWEE